MSVSPVDAVSSSAALAATDATIAVSRLRVAERLSLLKQQQVRLEAQRETAQRDTAMDDKTRATTIADLAMQQSRIDEQIRRLETETSDAAADAAAATRTEASDAADAAAATRTEASDAADAAAVSTTAEPPGSRINVIA